MLPLAGVENISTKVPSQALTRFGKGDVTKTDKLTSKIGEYLPRDEPYPLGASPAFRQGLASEMSHDPLGFFRDMLGGLDSQLKAQEAAAEAVRQEKLRKLEEDAAKEKQRAEVTLSPKEPAKPPTSLLKLLAQAVGVALYATYAAIVLGLVPSGSNDPLDWETQNSV